MESAHQEWSKEPEILLVEDDEDVREAVAEGLEDAGYVVVRASNGRDAIGHLRANGLPGLILLDLMMPELNGWDFCEIVRRDRILSEIPIVALTATASADRESLHMIDLADCVPKPFSMADVLATVKPFFHPSPSLDHDPPRLAA